MLVKRPMALQARTGSAKMASRSSRPRFDVTTIDPMRKLSTAADQSAPHRVFRVAHPFHSLTGQTLELLSVRQTGVEYRVDLTFVHLTCSVGVT